MLTPEKIEAELARLDQQMQNQTIALGRTQGAIAALRAVLSDLDADEETVGPPLKVVGQNE